MVERDEFFLSVTDAVARASSPATGSDSLVPPGRVKTRVLEAHAAEHSSVGTEVLLRAAAEPLGVVVDRLGDELWRLRADELVGFVDTLNPRFWQLHSTSPVGDVSRFINTVVYGNAQLDTAWMPTWLLNQLDGRHEYFKSRFEADTLLGDDTGARRWRATFEGDAPDDLLRLLASDDRYGRTAVVTGVGSTVEEPGVGSARVYGDYRGHFATLAGDFSVAASVIWNMVRRYEDWVRALENRHRLRAAPIEGFGFALHGDVVAIEFGREVENLDRMVAGLFAAKAPFRLWGVPKRAADDEWAVDAVDLHVGQPLRMQIGPSRLRVLLDSRTCGNTIARLLTNLQQHLDARSHLVSAAAA